MQIWYWAWKMEKPDSAWNFLKRKNKAQSEGGIGYGSFR
jgi:hypothetical protein